MANSSVFETSSGNSSSLFGRTFVKSPEERCLETMWTTPYPEGPFCNATWDSFYCWPTTPANTMVNRTCADVIGLNTPEAHKAYAFRACNSTGGWMWDDKTDFSECLFIIEKKEALHVAAESAESIAYVMFICSVLSFLALTLTLFIFSYFKSLRCDRISVHKHLAFALLVRMLLNVIITEPVVSARHGYKDLPWLCRGILIMKMYSTLAAVNWMFVEGFYLNSKVTTSVFSTKSPFRLYYLLGWGFPMIIVSLWSGMMAHGHDEKCWKGYTDFKYIWILLVPIYGALSVNLLFLINIIRILYTKLRSSVAIETTQVRKAIKATAVLFPLLGLPNLFVSFNPGDDAGFEDVYLYTSAILDSSQGIFVAILYCFTNSEVIETIKKEWAKIALRMEPTCNNNRRHSNRTVSYFETNTYNKSPFREVKKTFWVRWAIKYQKASTEVVHSTTATTTQSTVLLSSVNSADSAV